MNRVQEQKHHLALANRQIAELTVQIVRPRVSVRSTRASPQSDGGVTAPWDLFVCARDLFDGAKGKTRRALSGASLLADQQKSSDSYQQGKQNTGDERAAEDKDIRFGSWGSTYEIISYFAVGFVTCLEWHARSRLNRRSKNDRVLTIVVAELELGNIERHIFGAHLMKRPHRAALEDGPEALDCLGVNRTDDVLAFGMVNGRVRIILVECPVSAAEAAQRVRPICAQLATGNA
jgi:hypothetical protein